MDFRNVESPFAARTTFMYDAIYFQSPDEYARIDEEEDENEDWDDEEDEDFDDTAADIDDLNEIRADDDLNEPDAEYDLTNPDPDDDHLPEDDLQ